MKKYCSTAGRECDNARIALREAEDDEWNNPSDPTARRRVQFWTSQVTELSGLDPDTIIPLH
jgi:hypothetical protein